LPKFSRQVCQELVQNTNTKLKAFLETVCLFVCYLGMKHRRQSMLLFVAIIIDETCCALTTMMLESYRSVDCCMSLLFVGTVINRHEKKKEKNTRLSCVIIRTSERRPRNESVHRVSTIFPSTRGRR
jgi:hypothetical protein